MNWYQSDDFDCPYLDNTVARYVYASPESLSPSFYTLLLANNMRRSGRIVYSPACPSCNKCIQTRVDVQNFVPSASQIRLLKKNRDLKINLVEKQHAEESYDLYCRYVRDRHNKIADKAEAQDFLAESAGTTFLLEYRLAGKLVGSSWLDEAEDGISSVYFAWDTNLAQRGLGNFSMLYEIEYCKNIKKPWYYLGYWVEGAKTMEYKQYLLPQERLINKEWQRFNP